MVTEVDRDRPIDLDIWVLDDVVFFCLKIFFEIDDFIAFDKTFFKCAQKVARLYVLFHPCDNFSFCLSTLSSTQAEYFITF